MVFGVGSYTYQYCTRDTFGFAVKSTYGEVNGEGREIFKDPVTDNGIKKSARGRLCVTNVEGVYCLADRQDSMDPPIAACGRYSATANCSLRTASRRFANV